MDNHSINSVRQLVKQKIRWSGGTYQTLLKDPGNFKTRLSFSIIILLFFIILIFLLRVFITTDLACKENMCVLKNIIPIIIATPIFFAPYILMYPKKPKNIHSIFMIFIFSYLYFPFILIISVLSLITGTYQYFKLRKGGTGWKADD